MLAEAVPVAGISEPGLLLAVSPGLQAACGAFAAMVES